MKSLILMSLAASISGLASSATVVKISDSQDAVLVQLQKAEVGMLTAGEKISIGPRHGIGEKVVGEVAKKTDTQAIITTNKASQFSANQRVLLASVGMPQDLSFDSIATPNPVKTVSTVSAHLGFVTGLGMGDASPIAFGAAYEKPIMKNVSLGGSFDHWSINETAGVSVSLSSLAGYGVYTFNNIKAPVKPFAMGGLAMHRVSVGPYSDTDIGLDIGAGARYDIDKKISVKGQFQIRQIETSYEQISFGLGMAL